jgi:ubiquinone/menaquinone biosynthesis C-methylase UbiE
MESASGEKRSAELVQRYGALIGEVAWHSLTTDTTIPEVSDQHYEEIRKVLEEYEFIDEDAPAPLRILEVASYAHSTGYRLVEELGSDVTLFDISSNTLKLARRCAGYDSETSNPRLVSGDFHSLPFEDESFDFVYIYSALHHTWDWRTVLAEMQRVLAPGGLLFLGNEPVHRACCLYRFRTNRMNDFTQFEQKLYELGIIRTVAEPYLGSRTETLFGMIENQRIFLSEFLAQLSAETPILSATFTPEICMGSLENSWLQRADVGIPALADIIRRDLEHAVRSAAPALDTVSMGLGYGLPGTDDIEVLAKDIGDRIAHLPPKSDAILFRATLSEIFGAGVRVIAGKPGTWARRSSPDFKREYECRDGVYITFDDEIRELLLADDFPLPDIQTSSSEDLMRFYNPSDWDLIRSDGSGTRLTLAHQPGRVNLPSSEDPRLLIAKLSLSSLENGPCRLSICQDGAEIYSRLLWRPESFLCVVELEPSQVTSVQELEVCCEEVSPSRRPACLANAIHLYHLRVVTAPPEPATPNRVAHADGSSG